MASIRPSRILRPSSASARADAIISCLTAPSHCARNAPRASFTTSPARCKRDNNKERGVSAVRGTGLRPRQTLSVMQKDFAAQRLPTPVKIKDEATGTPDHGLWDFFKDQKLLQTPLEENQHGRSWTVGELRTRDWETLHQLWWVCAKERNRLATEKIERKRLHAGYGDFENENRDKTVQETMKAILDVLAERQLAYQEALELAKRDPEIDLSRTDGPQYEASAYDPLEADETAYDAQPEEPATAEPSQRTPLSEPEAQPRAKVNA